jgi:hypothetical protein
MGFSDRSAQRVWGELNYKIEEGRRTVKLCQINSPLVRNGHCSRLRLAALPSLREPAGVLSYYSGPWQPHFPHLLTTACKDLSFAAGLSFESPVCGPARAGRRANMERIISDAVGQAVASAKPKWTHRRIGRRYPWVSGMEKPGGQLRTPGLQTEPQAPGTLGTKRSRGH